MKKIIFLLVLLPFLPSLLISQEDGREAQVERFTEYVNTDTLEAAGDEIGNVFNNFQDEIKSKPPKGVVNWLVAVLGLLASLMGALRKYWPFLQRTFKNAKADTPVLIFSLVGGLIWAGFDLDITGEEWVVKASVIFTVAVSAFKIGLRKLWDRIFKRKETAPAAEQ